FLDSGGGGGKKKKINNNDTLNEVGPVGDTSIVMEGVTTSVGKSSYANVNGKPNGKKMNVRTLFTPGGNGIDVRFRNFSQMHNNIMAAGSRDRPPMLTARRYPQRRSRFLRYIDTRPNSEALRKCIMSGPYKPTSVLVQAVEATDDSPVIPEHTTVETPMNMSPENKALFLAEKEAIHLILTRIGDEIYSTVDACQTGQEMWEAIEMLQQGESLNIQDVKTNLFWEFDKFTSYDGETMGSYYTRFYKLMNEMIGNNLTVTTMQLNVQFLQQLQPEWSSNTCLVETDDSNVISDSPDMCEDDIQNDQNDVESDDERIALANLIANLKLDVDENKKIQKQLKKANTSLAQELKECKTILAKTSKSLGESISVRDSCMVALQTKQTEFEKYKDFNNRTVDYDKLKRKLNETLGQLALKDIEIKEGLKTKAYEISVAKHKHVELMKQSLLTNHIMKVLSSRKQR
nr:hypothetical protein [Tanacetum cinerariifolium]